MEYIPRDHRVVPSQYKRHGIEGSLVRVNEIGGAVCLSNRSLRSVDFAFAGLIDTVMRDRTGDGHVTRVLDLGAGQRRRAASELGSRYPNAAVATVDLTYSETGIDDNVLGAVGDMLELPFADESFDLVYSRQSLSVLAQKRGDIGILVRGIDEITRVLAVGGVALLDAAPSLVQKCVSNKFEVGGVKMGAYSIKPLSERLKAAQRERNLDAQQDRHTVLARTR